MLERLTLSEVVTACKLGVPLNVPNLHVLPCTLKANVLAYSTKHGRLSYIRLSCPICNLQYEEENP